MTKEEARLTLQENLGYLSFEHPGRITEAIKVALEALSIPTPPSNLDEATEEYAPDFSNDLVSKAAVDAVRDAFKAGAEWMAGQGRNEIALDKLKHE